MEGAVHARKCDVPTRKMTSGNHTGDGVTRAVAPPVTILKKKVASEPSWDAVLHCRSGESSVHRAFDPMREEAGWQVFRRSDQDSMHSPGDQTMDDLLNEDGDLLQVQGLCAAVGSAAQAISDVASALVAEPTPVLDATARGFETHVEPGDELAAALGLDPLIGMVANVGLAVDGLGVGPFCQEPVGLTSIAVDSVGGATQAMTVTETPLYAKKLALPILSEPQKSKPAVSVKVNSVKTQSVSKRKSERVANRAPSGLTMEQQATLLLMKKHGEVTVDDKHALEQITKFPEKFTGPLDDDDVGSYRELFGLANVERPDSISALAIHAEA